MTISGQAPWRGLYTATALPFNDDLSVDYDAYAEHVAWLAAAGTDGEVVSEASDLLYHVLVLLKARGLNLKSVLAELRARHEART